MYSFDEKNHKHFLDDKLLAGVTTILKVISPVSFDKEGNINSKTDMLMAWAVKLVAEELDRKLKDNIQGKEREELIRKCKRIYKQTRNEAGNYGTDQHKMIEDWIKKNYEEYKDNDNEILKFMRKFLSDNDFQIAECEKHVYSRKHMIGGICDLLLYKNGRYYIADIKTGKNWHKEEFWQIGAYDLAIYEMEKKVIEGYYIIHIPQSGKYDIIFENQTDKCIMAFLAALQIYRISLGQI